jgi:tRNA threonylcarbamoyladenosine biosynthesis protein TsaB
LILSIDTTHESGSLALTRGETLVEEVALQSPDGFAHVVFGEIRALLNRHDCPLSAIECFATATGPGSFTGVRVGITCIKGLAEATGRPVVGVSNLQALAMFGS